MAKKIPQPFKPLDIAVLTISDSRSLAEDTSGDYLVSALTEAQHNLHSRELVKDDKYQIRSVLSQWIVDSTIKVVLVTGGTGFSGRDSTPEAAGILFDKTIDGFGELFRQVSYQEIGSSTIQSRAVAGIANKTLLFLLPGSTNACRTAWEKIIHEQINSSHTPCNFVDHLL